MSDLWIPAPHLIPQRTRGPWEVVACQAQDAHVNTVDHSGQMPPTDTLEDLLTQMHESEHIHRSRLPGGSVLDWQERGEWWSQWRRMVEEIAVDMSSAAKGMPLARRHDGYDWTAIQPQPDRVSRGLMFLQLAVAAGGSQNADLLRYFAYLCDALDPTDATDLKLAAESVMRDFSPAHCADVTDILVTAFPPPPPPEPKKAQEESRETKQARQKGATERKERAERLDKAERSAGEGDKTAEHRDFASEEYTARQGADGGGDPYGGHHQYLVDVHLHTGGSQEHSQVGRLWRPTDSGATLRFPAHYPSGQVFARRARGGSILMDWSGSMAWDWEALKDALQYMPALWCGGYSSHAAVSQRKYIARLCILAESGQLGTWQRESKHTGGNNGADFASLAYMLSAHGASGPFIWVSDGLVGKEWLPRTDAVCQAGNVVRVINLAHAIDYLKGQRYMPYWQGTDGAYTANGDAIRYDYETGERRSY